MPVKTVTKTSKFQVHIFGVYKLISIQISWHLCHSGDLYSLLFSGHNFFLISQNNKNTLLSLKNISVPILYLIYNIFSFVRSSSELLKGWFGLLRCPHKTFTDVFITLLYFLTFVLLVTWNEKKYKWPINLIYRESVYCYVG